MAYCTDDAPALMWMSKAGGKWHNYLWYNGRYANKQNWRLPEIVLKNAKAVASSEIVTPNRAITIRLRRLKKSPNGTIGNNPERKTQLRKSGDRTNSAIRDCETVRNIGQQWLNIIRDWQPKAHQATAEYPRLISGLCLASSLPTLDFAIGCSFLW